MHVFTYGTLMFPEVWQAVVGRPFETVHGTLAGYQLRSVRDEVFPGIVAAGEHDVVRGVVYLDVDDAAIARLDLFEGDTYERQSHWIDCQDGERRTADAYVVTAANEAVLTAEAWLPEEFIARGHLAKFIAKYGGFSRLDP